MNVGAGFSMREGSVLVFALVGKDPPKFQEPGQMLARGPTWEDVRCAL